MPDKEIICHIRDFNDFKEACAFHTHGDCGNA